MAEKKDQSPLFSPQGFLIYQQAYGEKLEDSSVGENGNTYNQVAKLKGDYQPEVVVSKLVATDGIKVDNHLLNLENHKISALVPEIRLYRVLEDEKRAVPFYFPVAAEYDFDGDGKLNLEKSSFSAGAAVIESFSFSLAGTNPYQITRKFLNASLKIKVDNLSVLFNQKPGYSMLADLFTIRAGAKNTTFANNDRSQAAGALGTGQSCRIMATLGYSVPRDYNMFTSEEIITIEQTKQIVNLYYSGHDLNVQQDGATDVSISYVGYLQSASKLSGLDLFTDPSTKSLQSRRSTRSEKTSGNISKQLGPQEQKKKEKTKADEEEAKKKTQEDIAMAFRQIITDLYERGKIYRTEWNPQYYQATIVDSKEEAETPAEEKQQKADDAFSIFKKHPMHYFTFGDLLDSYFKKIGGDLDAAIKRNEEKKKDPKADIEKINEANKKLTQSKEDLKLVNVLLCDIKARRKKQTTNRDEFEKNIADIPISIDTFYTRVWTEIRSQGEAYCDMQKFLKFSLELLNLSLDGLQNAQLVEDITYSMSTFTSRGLKKLINRGVIKINDASKSTDSFTKSSIKDVSEYIVFHQEPTQYSRSPGSGNKKADTQKGIFHLRPNKDRGFLKNVTFSKIEQPARQASLVVGNGDLYDELRLPHNATATMFGNFMFLPGSQVYVDPNTLGFGSVKDKNSAARRLGFGGYYTVESVSTAFSGGQLETTLNLLFNAFPETDSEPTLSAAALGSIKEVTNMMGIKKP